MQFKPLFVLVSAVAAACAQTVQIGQPKEGFSAKKGKNFTVEVDRPNSLTGSMEVAITISLLSCKTLDCARFNASDVLGSTLYHGPYSPKYAQNAFFLPPHQNFSVKVPKSFTAGKARLAINHFSLVGAGPFALFETKNITINVTE